MFCSSGGALGYGMKGVFDIYFIFSPDVQPILFESSSHIIHKKLSFNKLVIIYDSFFLLFFHECDFPLPLLELIPGPHSVQLGSSHPGGGNLQSHTLGSPHPCMNGLKACGFQPVQFGSSHGGGNGPIMFAGQFGSSQHGICGIIIFAGQFGSSQQGSPSFPSSIGNGKKPPFPCSYCSRPARSGNCDTS